MTRKPITPTTLAADLGVDAKSLRGWLRKTYPRPIEAKNTAWILPAPAVRAARKHFAKQEAKA